MLYRKEYGSPLGQMTMISDGKGLTALSFRGQKYDRTDAAENIVTVLESRRASSEIVEENGGKENKSAPDIREESGACAVFDRTQEWLDLYFSGCEPDFAPPLSAKGTPFQEMVWEILRKIPYGKVISYGEIARQIAEKKGIGSMSAQAVGGAVGRNPVAIIVPCHRVVGSDGKLTGYAGGLDKKEALLKLEKWL